MQQLSQVPKDYFGQKIWETKSIAIFEAARVFVPSKVTSYEVKNIQESISKFSCLSILQASMLIEIPTYLVLAASFHNGDDLHNFWKSNQAKIPTWASAFQRVSLIQPSSAAVERVFSILQNITSSSQSRLLEDALEATLMRRYNHDCTL